MTPTLACKLKGADPGHGARAAGRDPWPPCHIWCANHVVGAAAQQHGALILSFGYFPLLAPSTLRLMTRADWVTSSIQMRLFYKAL
jgi:hypothetical protein